MSLRIISLNTWCGTMWTELASWLPSVGADVLCLQEVTHAPELRGWVEYDDGEHAQSQRADLFADLFSVLPRHRGTFVAHDAGTVVAGGRTHSQNFGMAIFVADHIPVVGHATSSVHGTLPEHRDKWQASGRPRQAQAVRIIDRTRGGRTATVAHVHGLRNANGKGDSPARLN